MAFHGRNLRRGRFSETGRPYLVTTVTLGRYPYFADLCAARVLVQEMRRSDETGLTQTLAWVVMPDHLHWLFSLHELPLSVVMRQVKSRTAVRMNQRLGRRGTVWQRGYHDHAIRRDEDIVAAARYIVANPLRSGLAGHIGDYPHWDAVWL